MQLLKQNMIGFLGTTIFPPKIRDRSSRIFVKTKTPQGSIAKIQGASHPIHTSQQTRPATPRTGVKNTVDWKVFTGWLPSQDNYRKYPTKGESWKIRNSQIPASWQGILCYFPVW